MSETSITCAHCGGHDFTLHITLAGTTMLRCVDHGDHVERLNLAEQRSAFEIMSDVEESHER